MKKTLLFLFLAVLLFALSSCASTAKVQDKASVIARYMKKGYSEEDATILAMTKAERLEYLCPYYDLPVDAKEYDAPDKRYRSILYAYVAGDYNQGFSSREDLKGFVCSHGDVVSFFSNAKYYDNVSGLWYGGDNQEKLSNAELFIRQVKAVRRAQEIHDELHEKGIITESMTEYEKAETIAIWMWENIGQRQSRDKGKSLGQVRTDSAYNCFFKEDCDCGARAGAYILLLHLEGIKAQSWHTYRSGRTSTNDRHLMTRALLDGTEYWIDWANSFRGIRTPEEWAVWDQTNEFNYFMESDAVKLF